MNRHETASNNPLSRRESISRMGSGFGGIALSALLGDFDESQNLPAYVSLPDPGGMPVDGGSELVERLAAAGLSRHGDSV